MDSWKHRYLQHFQSSLQNTLKTKTDFQKLENVELDTLMFTVAVTLFGSK